MFQHAQRPVYVTSKCYFVYENDSFLTCGCPTRSSATSLTASRNCTKLSVGVAGRCAAPPTPNWLAAKIPPGLHGVPDADGPTCADAGRAAPPLITPPPPPSVAADGRRAVVAASVEAPSNGVPYVWGRERPAPRPDAPPRPPMRAATGALPRGSGLRTRAAQAAGTRGGHIGALVLQHALVIRHVTWRCRCSWGSQRHGHGWTVHTCACCSTKHGRFAKRQSVPC